MTGSVETFENKLAEFTGAPYVVTTDCCTHAIELCFRLLEIKTCRFSAHTYISIPMTMELLDVDYTMTDQEWEHEYQFIDTPVWDSARCLRPNMYREAQYQCLSFGPGKPLDNVRGGAILLDDEANYKRLKAMSYDGREIKHTKWPEQRTFSQGFHYMMRYEECDSAIIKFKDYQNKNDFQHSYQAYTDLRNYKIIK